MKFKAISVGETFRFKHGTSYSDSRGICRKVSARRYYFLTEPRKVFTVGTINVAVVAVSQWPAAVTV